ncbi:MAG: DUF4251 domain-containing protein [Chitinophagaceae bacterium]|nr:DUF4251 domain-containing protein [Chitinophagaceae bacterium]
MKHLNNYFLGILCFLLCIYTWSHSSCSTTRQPTEVTDASEAETEQAIKTDRWIFIANQAIPQRGRAQMLTSRYTVLCNSDTIISSLPYFGRAYTAIIGETTSPLDFKSTDFSFNKNDTGKRKVKRTVTIKPNDYREVQSYTFTLYLNGSAQLNVQLTNRSPISFNGTVMPIKQ